jgi:hypothetical protein
VCCDSGLSAVGALSLVAALFTGLIVFSAAAPENHSMCLRLGCKCSIIVVSDNVIAVFRHVDSQKPQRLYMPMRKVKEVLRRPNVLMN